MAGQTISGVYPLGITLSNAGTANPVTITAGATISYAAGPAIQATGTIDWTIDNAGTVQSTATGTSIGITLASGTITNEAAGRIEAITTGISATSAATIISSGTILASSTASGNAILIAGGAVVNGAGAAIVGGLNGISLTAAGAVINSGSITGTRGDGAILPSGAFTNTTSSAVTGYTTGISIAGNGLVINDGSVAATRTIGTGYSFSTISGFAPIISAVILGAGSISNGATGIITSPRIGVGLVNSGSIGNAGQINGSNVSISGTATIAGGFGAWLFAGGSIDNAASGTIFGGFDGIIMTGTVAASVTNAGSLGATRNAAADFFGPGTFTSTVQGHITSGSVGVLLRATGTADNAGAIDAPYGILALTNANASNSGSLLSTSHNFGAGIQLKAGGTATNAAGGQITGNWIGIQIGGFTRGTTTYAPGGTVINDGTVTAHDLTLGNGAAVWVKGQGIILNGATGTIAGGPYGVVSYDNITIDNRGSISGSTFSVFASNAGNHDRIITHPGASFSGTVQGDKTGAATPNGTLELASGTATGTIAGFGAKYTGFSNVIIDAGANWSLAGTVSASQTIAFAGTNASLTLANPTAVAGTITGLGTGKTLSLAGITDVASATLGANNLLSVVETGGGTISLQLDPTQNFGGFTNFGHAINGTATDLTAPCFAQGTRIMTDAGAIAVEHLQPGMRARSAFGGHAPVVWIGHRRVDCARHPRPHDVRPIRIRAGAFAPGIPTADLRLSPDHAVHINGGLVPVRYLLNGRTILQEQTDSVVYYHVELPTHDVLLAEGLECESYLDTGNRGAFANADAAVMLHPDFALATWNAEACAPLIFQGPALHEVRASILDRAAILGHRRTQSPSIRLEAAGRPLTPRITANRWHIALPPNTTSIDLISRAAAPADITANHHDARTLGVAIANLHFDAIPIPLDTSNLTTGWHPPEPAFRWTTGHARIDTTGAHSLAFDLALTGTYWDDAKNLLGSEKKPKETIYYKNHLFIQINNQHQNNKLTTSAQPRVNTINP